MLLFVVALNGCRDFVLGLCFVVWVLVSFQAIMIAKLEWKPKPTLQNIDSTQKPHPNEEEKAAFL